MHNVGFIALAVRNIKTQRFAKNSQRSTRRRRGGGSTSTRLKSKCSELRARVDGGSTGAGFDSTSTLLLRPRLDGEGYFSSARWLTAGWLRLDGSLLRLDL